MCCGRRGQHRPIIIAQIVAVAAVEAEGQPTKIFMLTAIMETRDTEACIKSLPPLVNSLGTSGIPEAYNIITLTFLEFDTKGQLCFIIQGPYASASSQSSNDGTSITPWCDVSGNIQVNPQDISPLKDDIAKWRKIEDPWGRPKFVLVSIGGQNGSANWPPTGVMPEDISTQIKKFVTTYDLDGIDIDLENTQNSDLLTSRDLLIPTINDLRSQKNRKYIITCAPQASTGEIEEYRSKIILNVIMLDYSVIISLQTRWMSPGSNSTTRGPKPRLNGILLERGRSRHRVRRRGFQQNQTQECGTQLFGEHINNGYLTAAACGRAVQPKRNMVF